MDRFADISSIWESVNPCLIFTPKLQSSGRDKVSNSMEVPQHSKVKLRVKVRMKSPVLKASLCTVQQPFNCVLRKAITTIKKRSKRGEETGRGQGGQTFRALHSRAAYWFRVVFGFSPAIIQEHAAAHHLNGRTYAWLCLQDYCTREQLCASMFVRDS